MEKYTPNLSDPQVLKRMKSALALSVGMLKTNEPRQISKSILCKHFGQGQHNLGKFLRKNLLICTNEHYSFGKGNQSKCKEYILSHVGRGYISNLIKNSAYKNILEWKSTAHSEELDESKIPECAVDLSMQVRLNNQNKFELEIILIWARREFCKELRSKEFTYKDKSDRLWNDIQNIRSDARHILLSEFGYSFNYDISTCAQTLLLQYAEQNGLDEYMFATKEYISHKNEIRTKLCKETGLEIKEVKFLISALFCGARLSKSSWSSLYDLVDNVPETMELLQNNEYIKEIKKEISKIWKTLDDTVMYQTYKNLDNGKKRKLPPNCTQKWGVYFRQERKVLDSVREYLQEKNIPSFLEHDGWVTERKLDLNELTQYIKDKTGFKIIIEEEII